MKGKLFITFYIVLFMLLIIPYILWEIALDKELDVLIINKTVPDQNYINHKGISWSLNYNKYIKENKENYDVKNDYAGIEPLGDSEYLVREIEESLLSDYNLIYIADTYGVYEEIIKDGNPSLIYGGITIDEITAIKDSVYRNQTTLIAEFNSFANPTDEETREQITSILGVGWSGWSGRYFDDLDPNNNHELPLSIVNNYKEQSGDDWNYLEGGLVFVSEDDYVIVLEAVKDFNKKGVEFAVTERGEGFFGKPITSRYTGWFDILVAEEAEVMANFDLNLTEEGIERLKEYNIPNVFPAVTKSTTYGMPVYYFAGDYGVTQGTPSFYKYKWIDKILGKISSFQRNNTDAFYYHAYLPMMDKILEESFMIKQDKSILLAEEFQEDSLSYNSRVQQDVLEFYHDGTWEEVIIKGVNMGIAKPGVWPGEAEITFEEYYRWMDQIAAMGANTIRVYTIHPPEFYQALWMHNKNTIAPLHVMHGIWINEDILGESLDAFKPENTLPFEKEMKDVVDVIHGNAVLEDKPGHASGEFKYDVSPYISAWILGIEWSPFMVENTNKVNENLGEFQGNYFYTKNAEAFEIWLAARMDYITTYETENYSKQRLISFTNWPPTDILDHPAEPFWEEDWVEINPNSIYPKEVLKTGYFASYHVYPYYPEFLNYEEKYLNFTDHRGEKNNYAGYLKDLVEAHNMPVLIAEFGVPESRGKTHNNPFGLNQGNLSEKAQGEIGVRMFEDMIVQGAIGGIVFTWQDEWFKRTWNTMDLDNPDRRPYWSNVQTSEQRFGLLSFDAHKKPLDANIEKWESEYMLYENNDGDIKKLFMDHDEAYLYIMLEYNQEINGIEDMDFHFFFNTIQGQGNKETPFVQDLIFKEGIDFVLEINNEEENSRVWVDQFYDPFYYQYGYDLKILPNNEKIEDNTGKFNPIHLALSGDLFIPSTGMEVPFDYYETGKLKKGIGNPENKDYDSLADYYINNNEGLIEIRIPWLLLNFKDPSQKEIMGNLWEQGLKSSDYIEFIELSVGLVEKGKLIWTIPQRENISAEQGMINYQWESWETPKYKERLKESYYIFQESFLNNDMKFE